MSATKRMLLGWGLTFLLIVSSGVPAFAQTCVQPSSGIIAWWPLDETSGTTALDIVGNNDGTYVGTPQAASGMVSGSLQFDGISSYIVVPDSDLWAFGTSDFTLEFWANFDVPAHGSDGHPGNVFLSNDNGPFNVDKWIFALSDTSLEFIVGETATGSGVFAPVVPFAPEVGRWYHLALTRSGTTYKIYVDGVQVGSPGTNLSVIPNPASPLTIGAALEPLGSGTGFGGVMSGRLDEVTIYHRALTQPELAVIASAGSVGKCKALAVATRSVPAIKLGDPSSFQLKSRFGVPPFSWAIASGTLSPGMDLSSDGILRGTPTRPGSFTFTVKVTDSNNDTAEKSFTQDVVLVPPPPEIRIHKTGMLAVPGRTVNYFIVVENVGEGTAKDIEVSELLDPLEQFTDPSSTNPPVNVIKGNILVWKIDNLNPGEFKLLTYTVTLSPSVVIGDLVKGQAFEVCEQCKGRDPCHFLDTVCSFFSPELIPTGGGLSDIIDKIIQHNSPSRECTGTALLCMEECKNLCSHDSYDQTTTGPVDPNEKLVVAKKFIQPDQLLVYPIHFENIGDVEALDVFVTDVLDSNLDTSTLNILTPSGASFDVTTKTLKWSLLGRNLQPHETDNVLLSIRPTPNLPSGTEIRNKATIQFEIFESLDTNEVVNIIDSTKPTCTMNPLPATTSTLSFPISWSGTDAIGEIESYSVLVSVDGGSFTSFLDKTTDTSAVFTGELGKTYGFLCIATDTAGNIEVQDAAAETTTTITTTDLCPNDPNKTAPGVCGCGIADTDSDGDGTPNCNDQCPNDPARTVPSPEVCNGVDDNCDGTVDENNPGGGASCSTGLPGVCSVGALTCTNGGLSCQQNIQPTTEICDGLDNNCDGQTDEGLTVDGDGDGFTTPSSCMGSKNDCNDANGAIYPGATEVCGDSIDQDCDGADLACPPPPPVDSCTPTTVLDNFNRANGSVGTNWRGVTGTSFYRIAGNRLDVQAGGPLYWNPAAFGANQAAFVTLNTVAPNSPSQGVLLKVQSGSVPNAGAIAVVYDAAAKAVRVSTLRLGTLSWTPYGNTSVLFANGDKLGACAKANGEVRVYKNDTLVKTVTLTAADQGFFNTKGGKVGVWSLLAPQAFLDDFGGATIAP